MGEDILSFLERWPIIPAVKDEAGLEAALALDQKVLFLLYGDLCSLGPTIRRVHEAGKLAVVHGDLIGGLGNKEIAVDFLSSQGADGIISTRPGFIHRGRELGLFTIQRFFVFDSLSLESVARSAGTTRPDLVEILPGIMPRILSQVARSVHVPLICGGLIRDKTDVMEALGAGALAISATGPTIWRL